MPAKPVDGFGSYQYEDFRRFEGQWKASKPHGRGTCTWANGDRYEGEVKAGLLHGQGKYTQSDGTIIEGAFVNKLLHGLGAITYPNGNRYTGQWEKDNRHGQGTFVFANGTSWRGQWNDNEPATNDLHEPYAPTRGTWRFAGGGSKLDLGPGLSVREQPAASAATLREREERRQAAEALPADRLVGMRIEVDGMGQGVVVEKKSGAFGLGATEHVVRFHVKRTGTQQLKLRRKGNGGKAFIIAPPIAPPPPVLAAAPAGADTSPQAAQLHADDARRAVDGLRERLADAQRHCEAESAAARSAEEAAASAEARSREAAAAAAAAAAEAAGATRACASATSKAQSAGAAEAAAVKSVADLEAALEAAAIEAAEAGRQQQRLVESAAAAADAAAAAAAAATSAERAAAAAERAAQQALKRSCEPQVYTAAQLEAATSSFAERNLLAEGGFGKVYRGVLQPSGPAVAIKVLKPAAAAAVAAVAERHKQFVGAGSFRKELEVLSKYRHANIVGLLGFCLGSESAGGGGRGGGAHARQCLVFEFMAGGSLQERLASGTALPAQQRFDVASDVARGLRYLHIDADPPIIHQDVKSDNILLADVGGKLVAKVADFGTARYVPELLKTDVEHHSTKLVIGTKPYMPIEYLQSGHVSEKTDTFAFGVVLCELLTGHGPVFDRTNGVMLSVKMMVPLEHPERELAPLLDQRLGAGGSWPLPRAVALGRIARRCIEMDASRRCVVADVLPALNTAAGRPNVRLAGRGEEYDPRTGKLMQKR
jgi:serine/threonine-protein kinase PBS1